MLVIHGVIFMLNLTWSGTKWVVCIGLQTGTWTTCISSGPVWFHPLEEEKNTIKQLLFWGLWTRALFTVHVEPRSSVVGHCHTPSLPILLFPLLFLYHYVLFISFTFFNSIFLYFFLMLFYILVQLLLLFKFCTCPLPLLSHFRSINLTLSFCYWSKRWWTWLGMNHMMKVTE